MESSTRDVILTIVMITALGICIFALGYQVGCKAMEYNRIVYYDAGLSDGYADGIDTCGIAGITLLKENGTQWFQYTGPKSRITESHPTWVNGEV